MPELFCSPTLCQLSAFGGNFGSISWGLKSALGNSLQPSCTTFSLEDFTPFSLFYIHAASCISPAFTCKAICLEIDVSSMSSAVHVCTENRQPLSYLPQQFPAMLIWLLICFLKWFCMAVFCLWPCLCTPCLPLATHDSLYYEKWLSSLISHPNIMPFCPGLALLVKRSVSVQLQYLYGEGWPGELIQGGQEGYIWCGRKGLICVLTDWNRGGNADTASLAINWLWILTSPFLFRPTLFFQLATHCAVPCCPWFSWSFPLRSLLHADQTWTASGPLVTELLLPKMQISYVKTHC